MLRASVIYQNGARAERLPPRATGCATHRSKPRPPLCYAVTMTSTRYIALLRGVNVGRNKRIAMADLRALLAGLGYSDVQTLLQSGNAVFRSADPAPAVAAAIEQALLRELGVQSTVIVRSAAELRAAIAANPLLDRATDPAKHLVGFLAGEPDQEKAQSLAALDLGPDQARLAGRELYLWCPDGVLAATGVNWERQLGVAVTMRNWNTVTKLAAMAGE